MIHLDTHVVAWLYAGRYDLLPGSIQARLEAESPRISPMVLLELDYLHEIGRTRESSDRVLENLGSRLGLRVSEATFRQVVFRAGKLSFTRDPFDRLIVANAMADEATLLTADRQILENVSVAAWG